MNKDDLSRKLNIPHIIVSFVTAAAMYVLIMFICGVVPFGDKTWLSFDMKRQYVDFYAYYRTVLNGDNNVFYSFSTALGSGTIGFFVYYLTSPFLFIVSLFPVDRMPLAITLVIGLKLACASATCDSMLQKLCGRSTYLCSLSYAFCVYMMSNAMNVMWLDALILLPVMLVMTEKLLHEGKLLGYTICTALMLYLNYYISYIALIFILLWSIVRLWAAKNKAPQEAILRLGLATGAGVGIDAVFLLPTLLELRNSPKDILDEGLKLAGEDLHIHQILSKMFSLSYDSLEVYWGKPLLFCGTVLLVFTLMYYFTAGIPVRERLGMAILHIVLIISFKYDDINLLWHAGMEPSGYPYREAILFVLLSIICSCRFLQEYSESAGIKGMIAAYLIIAAVAVYVFRAPATYMYQWKVYLNISLLATVLFLTAVLIITQRRALRLGSLILLAVIQLADLGCNGVYIYGMESMMGETAGEYSAEVHKTEKAVRSIKKRDLTFYRTENLTPRQQNDAMMHDYYGVTHYSSAGLTYVRYFLQKMGFNDDGLYTDYGHDNTKTADSILGVKYVMTDRDSTSGVHEGYELVDDGDVRIYRNPYALPVAVGVYHEMSGDAPDPFSLQEDIYGRLIGEPVDIFVPAYVQETAAEENDAARQYRLITEAEGELYFYMTDLIGSHSNLEIYVNGEFYSYYGNASCTKVLDLGRFDKGKALIVEVIADDSGAFGNALFVTENREELARAYDKTVSRHAKVERLSASRLAMTIDSAYTVGDGISGDVGVFTTIPYQKGWRVKVAGVKVEPVEVYDALMYIPVTEALQRVELGPNEDIRIELEFIPEGFIVGLIASIFTIVVIILMASIRKGEASFFGDLDDTDEEDEDEFSELIFPPADPGELIFPPADPKKEAEASDTQKGNI